MPCSLKDLEEYTGIPRRTLNDYRTRGMFSTEDGTLADAIHAVLAYYRDQIEEIKEEQQRKLSPLDKEEIKLKKARRRKLDIESETLEGTLVSGDAAIAIWMEYIQNVKARLTAMPTRLAVELQGIASPNEIEGILREAIDEALLELSKGLAPEDLSEAVREELINHDA